jgi:hypothetical protein
MDCDSAPRKTEAAREGGPIANGHSSNSDQRFVVNGAQQQNQQRQHNQHRDTNGYPTQVFEGPGVSGRVDATSEKASVVDNGVVDGDRTDGGQSTRSSDAIRRGERQTLSKIMEGIRTHDANSKDAERRANCDTAAATSARTIDAPAADDVTTYQDVHPNGSPAMADVCIPDQQQQQMHPSDTCVETTRKGLVDGKEIEAVATAFSVLPPVVEEQSTIAIGQAAPEPRDSSAVTDPPSPRRSASPTKESCFTKLAKFRKSSVGSSSPQLQRRRSASTASSGSGSGPVSPGGPESPGTPRQGLR